MDVEVDVEVYEFASRQFVWMLDVKILFSIVPHTDAERLTAIDAQRAVVGKKRQPSHVASVAVVLRPDIIDLVINERHRVSANVVSSLAVRIVLPWTATIIIYLIEVLCQTHSHAEFWHQRNIGRCRTVIGFHLNVTRSVEAIDDVIFCTNWQCK